MANNLIVPGESSGYDETYYAISPGSSKAATPSSSGSSQTTPSLQKDTSTGQPIVYTSQGQKYYKDNSGQKIDITTNQPIPVVQPQPKKPTIITQNNRVGYYAEITEQGVQDRIYTQETSGSIKTQGNLKPIDYQVTPELKEQIRTSNIPVTAGYSVVNSKISQQAQTSQTGPFPERKLYKIPGGVTTQAPFFSKEGQKQRILSAGTLLNPFSSQRIYFLQNKDVTLPVKAAVRTGEVLGGVYLLGLGLGGAGATAATQAAKATTFLTGTKTGVFTTGLLSSLAVGEGTRVGVEAGANLFTPKNQKEIMNMDYFNRALSAGYESERQGVKGQPWYKRLAYEVPVLSIWAGDKKAYEEGARNYFISQGLTGAKLENAIIAAKRGRTTSESAQGAAFLTSSAASEIIGQRLVTIGFSRLAAKGNIITKSKSFSTLFVEGFKDIAPAGFIEGVTQELVQQKGRRQETNYKNVALMGAFGAGSAGLVGGSILGLSLVKPGISKAIELGSYISDPYEYIGDVTARGIEKGAAKVFKLPVSTPVVFETFAPSDVIKVGTQTSTPTKNKQSGLLSFTPFTLSNVPSQSQTKQSGVFIPTNININSFVETPTPSTAKTKAPINPFINIPSNIPSNTPTITPTSIITDIPINPFVNIPANTNTDIPSQIPTNVPTNVPISIPIGVPVTTPIFRLPPPLPLFPNLDLSSGAGAGSSKRKRTTYLDELSLSRTFFDDMNKLMYGTGPKKIKKKKKK